MIIDSRILYYTFLYTESSIALTILRFILQELVKPTDLSQTNNMISGPKSVKS